MQLLEMQAFTDMTFERCISISSQTCSTSSSTKILSGMSKKICISVMMIGGDNNADGGPFKSVHQLLTFEH